MSIISLYIYDLPHTTHTYMNINKVRYVFAIIYYSMFSCSAPFACDTWTTISSIFIFHIIKLQLEDVISTSLMPFPFLCYLYPIYFPKLIMIVFSPLQCISIDRCVVRERIVLFSEPCCCVG